MKPKKVKRIALDGVWKLKNSDYSIKIDAQVPGTVFEALLENKIIEDPFYGENEHNMKWVYESNWIFELEFDLSKKFLEYKNILLCFNGLDTIAKVFLNDKLIGHPNNMFVRYEFNIKRKLRESGNIIKIKFESPISNAQKQIDKFGIKLNTGYAAIPGVPYLRKAQYSFGWDWGPKLPDIGIWKSVELVGYNDLKLSSIYQFTEFKYNTDPLELTNPDEIPNITVDAAKLFLEIELAYEKLDFLSQDYRIKIELKSPNNEIFVEEFPIQMKTVIFEIDIKNPVLWWTHDIGDPNLYELKTSILKESTIDNISQMIGIRDIRLIRKADKWGESFYFVLNGIPIFAKGANWIPVDSFISRGRKLGLYSMNLNYAKKANMNMIRVWGGGIYEDDIFYDLCDKLGILVWQDFPFACALYPFHDTFIKNVKEEAIQNIKRLRNHPSLVLWCGNNEIEMIWDWISKNWKNPIKEDFKIGYIKIFEILIPDLLNKYDPHRPYWPSSPSNGFVGENLGTVNANSPNIGDSHFWDVWHKNKPFSAYRKFKSRFMSEFGYESFPSLKTIANFCPKEQYDFFSPIMENHQKNSAGNQKIMDYMEKRFSIPQKFDHQIILSQLTQAEAIEYGVEFWRQNRNEKHCMGSLYWQLNDCWPVTSWSSLDYYGRWKALHYFAKRFYQPIIASIRESSQKVEFWVVNDLIQNFKVILEWQILNSDGKVLLEGTYNSNVFPCSALQLGVVDVSNINKNKEKIQNNVVFYKLFAINDKKRVIDRGFRLFDAPKFFNLRNPRISIYFKDKNGYKNNKIQYGLKLKAKNIALYVNIQSNLVDFIASDNFFSMKPNESMDIDIKITRFLGTDKEPSKQDIIKSFKIRSLYDIIK